MIELRLSAGAGVSRIEQRMQLDRVLQVIDSSKRPNTSRLISNFLNLFSHWPPKFSAVDWFFFFFALLGSSGLSLYPNKRV
jgi:hypothetical protein